MSQFPLTVETMRSNFSSILFSRKEAEHPIWLQINSTTHDVRHQWVLLSETR
jgi:hypothetical protein